jgi:ferrochelatase
MKKTAVILFNLGGPEKLSDVRPFLFNLFSDKAIIPLPNPLRWCLAKIISTFRNKKTKSIYKQMGGGSPLLRLTQDQAKALESKLGKGFKTFVSMRYWSPLSSEVTRKVKEYAPDEVLFIPLYPQFSTTTTESSFKDFYGAMQKRKIGAKVKALCCFFENERFLRSHRDQIIKEIKKTKSAKKVILFSAHGLPLSVIEKGDPYQYQVEKTVEKIMDHASLKNIRKVICYQSKVGPKKWLEPSTEEEIKKAGERGDAVIVVPIAFVSEHSETLVELDIEYRDFATNYGVKEYYRVPALGTNENFIDSLKEMCLKLSKEEAKKKYKVFSSEEKRLCLKKFCRCINSDDR